MSFEGGYFSYLRKHISDDALNNLVKVTANTVWHYNATCKGDTLIRTFPDSLIKSDVTRIYHSELNIPAKIVFDMKGSFSVTGLALRGSIGCEYLKTYTLQGSNNRREWRDIITNSNDELRFNYNWHNYTFEKQTFRYLRIFQSEDSSLSHHSGFYFALTGVDFVGSMLKYIRNTCQVKTSRNYLPLIFVLLHVY